MRLDFKRFLSGVLALVMMVSTLTVVNVVSVFADMGAGKSHSPATGGGNGYWDISADSAFTDFTYQKGTNTSVTTGDLTLLAASNKDLYVQDEANSDGYMKANGSSEYKLANCKKNDKIYIYYYSTKGDGERQLTIKENDAAVDNGTKSLNKTSGASVGKNVEHTVTKDCTVSFKFNGDGIGVYAIDRISATPEEKYSWELITTGLTTQHNGEISIKTGEHDLLSNTLSYTGNDYIVNPDYVNIQVNATTEQTYPGLTYDESSKKFTLTIDDNVFKQLFIKTNEFELTNIHFDNAQNRYVRLNCEIHKSTVHTLYLDESGYAAGYVVADEANNNRAKLEPAAGGKIYLPQDKYYISIAGGTVALTEPGTSAGTSEVEIKEGVTAIKGTFTANMRKDVDAAAIGDPIDITKGLVMNDDVDETYIYDGTILDDYFEVHGTENFNGDILLIKDTDMSTGDDPDDFSDYSNVKALELRTLDNIGDVTDSSLRFKVADGVENLGIRVICSSSTDTANSSIIGLREGNGADFSAGYKPDPVKTQEISASMDGTAEAKLDKFEVELNANTCYGIYNAGKTDKNDNVRIYGIQFYDTSAVPALQTIDSAAVYNLTDGVTGSVFTDTLICGNHFELSAISGANCIGIKSQNSVKYANIPKKSTNQYIRFKTSKKFDVKFTIISTGNDKTSTIGVKKAEGTDVFNKDNTVTGQNPVTVTLAGLEPGEYQIYEPSNARNVYLSTVEFVDAKPTISISGSVMEEVGYTDATGYKSTVYYTGTKTDNKCDANVSGTASKLTPIADAKVTITNGNDVNKTIEKLGADGSFSYTGETEEGLKDGAYTVTAKTADGKAIGKAQTVTIKAGVADISADFVKDDRITVTFQTDIKDYKDDIVVSKDGGEVFRLNDVTYHYVKQPAGTANDIARLASVVHKVKLPAGEYSFAVKNKEAASTRYDVSTSESSSVKTASLTKTDTQMLYLEPIASSGVIEAATTKAGTLGDNVSRGTYKFASVTGPSQESSITHTLGSQSQDEIKGIYAQGSAPKADKPDTNYADNLMVNDADYIVFKIGAEDKFVTKITVAKQSYILAGLNGTKINGRDSIAIDSRYGGITLILGEGTYVLYTSAKDKADGYVVSIEFNYASPFSVISSATANQDGGSLIDAKMIVGAFDNINDINDFTEFAIIVSASKEALDYTGINNALNDPAKSDYDATVTVTEPSEDVYTPSVDSLTAHYGSYGENAPVEIDKTTTLFKKVINANGATVIETSDDDFYYYSTIVNNAPETLYAVGAAKTNEENAKWMVQSEVFDVINNKIAE